MADYTAAIGTGTIMIRDTGGNVEFWLTAGNNIAFDYGLTWSGFINGRGVGGTFRYNAGMGWQRLFVEYVGSNQNVSFTKTQNSGSTGLGGPATVNAYIGRSTIPPAPNPIGWSNMGHTTGRYQFNSAGDGGSPILEWQVGWGANPNTPEIYVGSGGTHDFTGLGQMTMYYAWARGRNANGWSAWSARTQGRTKSGGRIKKNGVWVEFVAYKKHNGVWITVIPFTKVNGAWRDNFG